MNSQFSKNTKIVVINLKERKEKRDYIRNHLLTYKLDFNFFTAEKHNNPKRGCLESHLEVIKKYTKPNTVNDIIPNIKYLMILEDDAKFINNFDSIKSFPSNWDMIYFGGTVHRILDRNNNGFARVQCWTTHCYIINLENKTLVNKILKELPNYQNEVDRYYLEKIHPNFNCYMVDPMICIQKEGFSDIENRMVNYDFMQNTLQGLRAPENSIDFEGNYVLKLDDVKIEDLPSVSIITPTYKRRKIFSMALRNFENFIYPRNKLEWIIVEDTPNNNYNDVEDLLPRDSRIKYIRLESGVNDSPMTIAMKRNIAVSNSSNEYIIHMDDDDYYPPESILARIKILLKYKKDDIECVGSTFIGTYNIINNTSSMSSDGPISLSEASMAYTRKFWEERPFDENCIRGEHKYFTEQRLQKIIDIPYSFILIAINHKMNFTEELRSDNSSLLKYSEKSGKYGEIANFFDTWDIETQMFIIDLRSYLLK
jgi:GR25 family glycosyltransferase involved in LPS biosynthesis